MILFSTYMMRMKATETPLGRLKVPKRARNERAAERRRNLRGAAKTDTNPNAITVIGRKAQDRRTIKRMSDKNQREGGTKAVGGTLPTRRMKGRRTRIVRARVHGHQELIGRVVGGTLIRMRTAGRKETGKGRLHGPREAAIREVERIRIQRMRIRIVRHLLKRKQRTSRLESGSESDEERKGSSSSRSKRHRH